MSRQLCFTFSGQRDAEVVFGTDVGNVMAIILINLVLVHRAIECRIEILGEKFFLFSTKRYYC